MEKEFDIIVIGAGVAGALIADRLVKAGKRVLILEAGERPQQRVESVETYLNASIQSLGSPYNPVPLPARIMARGPESENGYYNKYYDQQAPATPSNNQFKSTYERRVGGTTWHWLGNCPRLLPSDFETETRFGWGKNWPITYADLESWYCKAEWELGVAGDHEELNGLFGASRSRAFPMTRIWPSYSDIYIGELLKRNADELSWSEFNNEPTVLKCTPQARNSAPYDDRPVCTGNSSCVPICPIGAKYDASVHINKAVMAKGNPATLIDRAIVTKIQTDTTGLITSVTYINYENEENTVAAQIYILAANAIETPKLLLMSGVANSSDQVGRNLMDHPQGEGLCISPEPLFPFRGPPTTSGIDKFRDGYFRKKMCAFRISMGNDGWGRTKTPAGVLGDLIKTDFGSSLRSKLRETVIHQFRISFLAEMKPSSDNRVTLSTQKDDAGLPRPKLTFKVDDYTIGSYPKIGEVMRSIFLAMGSAPENIKVPVDTNVSFLGAGHVMGTCRMGSDAKDSVVDAECRSHDCRNLYIVGASVFPTGGTANPTLTVAALSLRAAESILKQLN